MTPTRCHWPKSDLMIAYHDDEWGVPSRDDRHLFEHLVLEGAQAGLNWELVLKKRRGYRKAFANYNLKRIAAFDAAKLETLAQDPGIVRNRLKISVGGRERPRRPGACRRSTGASPPSSGSSPGARPATTRGRSRRRSRRSRRHRKKLSKELVRRGFKFFGPTGAYAFMQAVGMVNDHLVSCYRYRQLRPR